MTVLPPLRALFDTTVLWGAFHSPAGPNAKLLDLAAQRAPMLDGFITDAVGAEFWWRATQQGVKGTGQGAARTYTEAELEPFLAAYEPLFEPEALEQAPLSRSLGRYAALVGRPLGEALHDHRQGPRRAARRRHHPGPTELRDGRHRRPARDLQLDRQRRPSALLQRRKDLELSPHRLAAGTHRGRPRRRARPAGHHHAIHTSRPPAALA